jgi:parvulin-like peptidyl-prolyl isomerase
MRKLVNYLLIGLLVISFTACTKKEKKPEGEIVAKVGEQFVTKADFDKQVQKSLSRYQSLGRNRQPAIEMRIKQNVLRRMVDNIIISSKAADNNVVVSDQEVKAKLEEHKKRFGGEKAFNDYLKRTHNTVVDLEGDIRNNLLRERLVEKLGGNVAITDEELKEHYEKNKQRYVEPEKIKASHILFKVEKNTLKPEELKKMTPEQRKESEKKATAAAKKSAEAKAKKVLKKAKKKGADFAELAKQYSEGPTATKGGDLGYFSKRRMVKPFSEAAFKMKVGDVSDLVETRFGFHIIKVFDKKPEVQKPFEEVSEQIRRSLEGRRKNDMRRQVLKKLKDEVKVDILVKFETPKRMPPQGLKSGHLTPGQLKPPTHTTGKVDTKSDANAVDSKPNVADNKAN